MPRFEVLACGAIRPYVRTQHHDGELEPSLRDILSALWLSQCRLLPGQQSRPLAQAARGPPRLRHHFPLFGQPYASSSFKFGRRRRAHPSGRLGQIITPG